MKISKIAILLLAMSLVLSTPRVFAQSKQSETPAQEDILSQAERPPIDSFIGVDEVPMPIKQVQPKYPEAAKKANLEGMVWLRVLVNKLGTVDSVVVQKPMVTFAELEKAAAEAARQWVFKPAIKDGKPMAVWVSFPTVFKLGAKSKK
jgi:TonB family protein